MTPKKPLPPGKPTKSAITDDEASLWQFIAGSIEPLKKPKGRVHTSARDDSDSDTIPARPQALAGKPGAPKDPFKPPAVRHAVPAAPPGRAAPPMLADFDRKKARKIRTGQIEIEARIDLHGMRQSEAHDALRHFLTSCFRRDQRWVLVITGKGGPRTKDSDGHLDYSDGHRRGILRQNVPRWLNEPELRSIVVSYTHAAVHHGGEGALYIHLRSSQR